MTTSETALLELIVKYGYPADSLPYVQQQKKNVLKMKQHEASVQKLRAFHKLYMNLDSVKHERTVNEKILELRSTDHKVDHDTANMIESQLAATVYELG